MLPKTACSLEWWHIRHIDSPYERQNLFWCLDGHNVCYLRGREHFPLASSRSFLREMMS
jgi:hypothetical protein